jgi:Ser/Thr protein kinase RdoA (MazF antagonist)
VPFVDTPLTERTKAAVAEAWGLAVGDEAGRLHGGEESAAFRIGSHVVRVGPSWRSSEELEWCHAVAAAAAESVPEVIAPRRTPSGASVVRVEDRPVSVWPFVEGVWVDDDDEDQWLQAADLLARLHRALAERASRFGPRPQGAGTFTSRVADDDDRELDRWLRSFDARANTVQPLHGDFYAGNMLACDNRIVGLLDWDEALLGPPERELAWAAWEFGDGLWADNLDEVHEFMHAYREAGGPAEPLDDVSLRQLVRQRLRAEVHYVIQAQARGTVLDDDDLEYHHRTREVLSRLRP